MKTTTLFLAPVLLAATSVAQTQLVRGDIDGIQGTQRFQLECTQIPLISSTVSLQVLHDLSRQQDIEFEMQVVNVGTATQPILDVITAVQIPEIFDMGNLRFGRSESWEVRGVAGSPTAVFLTARSLTGYLPLGPAGTWLLTGPSLLLRTGFIGGQGRLQFNFTMPTIPSLVGVEFTAQALVAEPAGLLITNPDCKDVRSS